MIIGEDILIKFSGLFWLGRRKRERSFLFCMQASLKAKRVRLYYVALPNRFWTRLNGRCTMLSVFYRKQWRSHASVMEEVRCCLNLAKVKKKWDDICSIRRRWNAHGHRCLSTSRENARKRIRRHRILCSCSSTSKHRSWDESSLIFPSLLELPTIIADNAGYDSAELVANLRAAHTAGKSTYGLGRFCETIDFCNESCPRRHGTG